MLFHKLADNNHPEELIDTYQSLIWTERYRAAGDFELKTTSVDTTRSLLTLGSLVCIKESRELMFVETHAIEDGEDDVPVLTVTGRSYETFYENRVTLTGPDPLVDPRTNDRNEDIDILDSTSAGAALKVLQRATNPELIDPVNAVTDKVTRDITTGDLEVNDRSVPRGEAYSAVLDLLAEDNLGIKNERPIINESSTITTYIYDGVDRTSTVILDVAAGHFNKVSYLWSIKGYKTAVYSASKHRFLHYYRKNTSELTGQERRVGLIDSSDITSDNLSASNKVRAKARSYIANHNKTQVFEGEVAPNIPYVYGEDYSLGDIIMCSGAYNVNEPLRIIEYIRTEDRSGENAYPSLGEV